MVSDTNRDERRRFIRHPLSYPLKTLITDPAKGHREIIGESHNIGAGGLLFKSDCCIKKGSQIRIEIEVEGRKFVVHGFVVRCMEGKTGEYNIAIAFDTPHDVLKARMMEQVVRIELFKKRVERRYGVKLDFACIAKVWINRYSKIFARHLHS